MTNIPSETQNILDKNILALEKYYPQIHSTIKKTLSSYSISFFGPEKKSLTISDTLKEITISAQQREEALSRIVQPGIIEPIYLIIGLGVGDELQELYKITQVPFPQLPDCKIPIYIIEPEPLMLIATMSLHDMREQIQAQRIQWFIGDDAQTKLTEYFNSNRQAIPPTIFITNWHSEDDPVVLSSMQNISEAINKTSSATYQLKIKNNRHYSKITQEEWWEIFTSQKRPLRIMGGTSRFTSFLQYCMRDLLEGFKELGHETLLYIETSDINRTTQHDILAKLDEFHPDLIINIDHNRDEFPYLPKNIPFMNWIQDLLPSIIQPNNLKLYPYDFIFVFGDSWVNLFKNNEFYKDHDIHFLPIGINKNIYQPIPRCEKIFDVLYVSHIIDPSYTFEPFRDPSQQLKLTDNELTLIDNGAISHEELILVYTLIHESIKGLLIDELHTYSHDKIQTVKLFENALNFSGIEKKPPLLKHFEGITRLTSEINFRTKSLPIKALKDAGLTVRAYGKNWEKVSDLSDISYGPITNGQPLNELMNQARICLNNSPGTSFHMRALEILGAGSFMISRRIKHDVCDITNVFPEYKDVVLFNNEADIVNIAKYYIKNELERENIANAGYKHATKKFCYKNISKTILTKIQENITPST